MNGVKKIFIIDDHPVVRQGLKMFIETGSRYMVCGEAAHSDQALKEISRTKPDLVTVDISLKGQASGLDLLKKIRKRHPGLPALVISVHDESLYAERALRAGARGYIMKREAQAKIVAAIDRLLEGKLYLSDASAQGIIAKSLFATDQSQENNPASILGHKEFEVFRLIGLGLGTRDIADNLGLSMNTIDSHKRNIKRKLNIGKTEGLVKYAIQWTLENEKSAQ